MQYTRLQKRLHKRRSAVPSWRSRMLALFGALSISTVACAVDAQGISEHRVASERWQALRGAAAPGLPTWTDPQARSALETLSDVRRFLPPALRAELPELTHTCDRVRDIVVAYQTHNALQSGELQPQLLVLNARRYQAELAALQPFLADCVARQIPLAEAVLEQIAPHLRPQLRLGGLKRGQSTVMQLYAALSNASSDPQIEARHWRPLLFALAANAHMHARALTLADREALYALAQSRGAAALTRDAAQKKAWQKIGQAMKNQSCTGLCALGRVNSLN